MDEKNQAPAIDEKNQAPEEEGANKIVIYSTPTCGFCKMAKEFFTENNIPFTDHNVVENDAARDEMIEKSGQSGVPVIFIGEEMVIGFDKAKVTELLGL